MIDEGNMEKSRRMRGGTGFFIVAMSVLVAACGPSEEPGTAPPVSSDEAKTPDGKALVQALCTTCHTSERIDATGHDRAGWERTVDRMIKTGARLPDSQRKVVVDYLAGR